MAVIIHITLALIKGEQVGFDERRCMNGLIHPLHCFWDSPRIQT
jgi:hypothetical protein